MEFYNNLVRQAEQRRMYPPFVELKNIYRTATGIDKKNKHARIIAALQPLFEKGKYYIKPEHLEARDELLTIGSSRWDDLSDALAYCENILTPMYFDSNNKKDNIDIDRDPVFMAGKTSGYGMEY